MQKRVSTLIGIIIIVAVALVVFGGVFAYQYFATKHQPVDSTDQTAGWKTYTNTQYGFEFKYPQSINDPRMNIAPINPNFVCDKLQSVKTTEGYGTQEEIIVNNNRYCVLIVSEGAAGTSYYHYNYTTNRNGNQLILSFVLSFGNCGAYLDKEEDIAECEAQVGKFDINTIDEIFSTFKFTTPADQTADWQTYTNTQYGFEVKYPKNWENCNDSYFLLSIIPPISSSDIPQGMDEKTYKGYSCGFGSMAFRVQGEYSSLEELKNYYKSILTSMDMPKICPPEKSIEDIVFNGQPAVQVANCDSSGLSEDITIALIRNRKAYEIISWQRKTEELNKILSTFKFTNITDQTAGWKTYTNTEYGFELKYPPELSTERYGSGIQFEKISSDGIKDYVFSINNGIGSFGGQTKYQNVINYFNGIYQRQSESFNKKTISVAGIDSIEFSGIFPLGLYENDRSVAKSKEIYIFVPKKIGNNQCDTAADCGAEDFFGINWVSAKYFRNRNYSNSNEVILDHDEDQFNQIISTFKFTTPAGQTAGKTDFLLSIMNKNIEIRDKNTGNLIQNIPLSGDILSWNNNLKIEDVALLDNDINFDGYKDLQILTFIPADNPGIFDFYIYNPSTGKFGKDPVLQNLVGPSFYATAKAITSDMSGGCAGMIRSHKVFSFRNGKYYLDQDVEKNCCSDNIMNNGSPRITINNYENGKIISTTHEACPSQ